MTPRAHGLDDELRQVPPEQWLDALAVARDEGHGFFDWIGCVDEVGRSDELRVIARLVDFDAQPMHGVQLHCRVPREDARLPTCTGLFAGAAWHEREVHDFFGVVFDGGDQAPLLNHAPQGASPVRILRKDVVLGARAAQPWPGAKEAGEGAAAPSRRKMAPPGVPDAVVWGDRDPSCGPADPAEIAAAVAGGRVRRGR
ncbi:MAG: NADH-quinone oxidoreductase subunit C [Luteococcus sp.]|uniref:NADH-quinone oxidoreductase subunit C n=1 Tax=Luteococcus sp. TaxID=1969402 RepID=UPI002649D642|nr:NADH-quinone oxidoreductase subunit C [Luteococcus sp.]MDN5562204.1 NADH-quinone oxidoreductase subunit C [Luteococcus sp.]